MARRGLTTEAPAAIFLGVLAWAVLINLQRGTLGEWLAAKFLNAGAVPPLADSAAAEATSGGEARIPGVFTNPVPGSRVVDSWGSPRSGGRTHQGIDLAAPRGTPVVAAQAGEVTRSGSGGLLCGIRVAVRHTSKVETIYCHLEAVAVPSGVDVRQGQTIGYVGTSGNAAGTGPHLHFEIRVNGVPTNPAPFLS